MRHPIDPKIDCFFNALLGAEDNRNLLVHFLNAILGPELPRPIAQVEILNPYNEREFLADKLSIVDVKARDDQARLYQVEIQLLTHRDLPARILYTWTDLYSQQLQSGQGYGTLRPTYTPSGCWAKTSCPTIRATSTATVCVTTADARSATTAGSICWS
jgi:predicted transposase/invertase (TIGR01784 family)